MESVTPRNQGFGFTEDGGIGFDGMYSAIGEAFSTRDREFIDFSPPINDLSARFSANPGEPFVIEVDWQSSSSGFRRLDQAPPFPPCASANPVRIVKTAKPDTFEREGPHLMCGTPPCTDPMAKCTVGLVFEIIVGSFTGG